MRDIWTGEKLRLRGVEPEDWRHFRELARDLDGVRAAGLVEPPRSDESFRRWTAERAGRPPGGEAFRLVVEDLADGGFAGAVTVGEADRRAGRFRMGVEIGRAYRRRGYGREAVSLLLGYMFREERFHKCEVEVNAFNEASLALFRGVGFVEEGRLREHEFVGGVHHDVVVLGITAPEHAG
ncbi:MULTISPECIES: GNAT family N-acetyltransferase [Streptomyces]|uniref:GNAT family N-acetyltransferase n=1 Tax=Streptomyces odorifer TaxID=53450 RepID=A0A7Y6C9K6_9ACTN|nr:GNAT family protein [Streptomyces odorifer]NUV29551.1 GNAT family N-acetyltransferase [Streptomyces odorifer]NUV34140.1 GNAT family N-acetyltransferase [Streptomyces sp. KAI-27]NUV51123.1 GNAT family N-acetyltransferase [Streptomyces sp. CAI-78]